MLHSERQYGVKALCVYSGVSRAAYYAWRGRVDQADKDQERMRWVQEAYQASHRIYGYRRIKLWLSQKRGLNLNHKAILRLMNKLGIRLIARRRRPYPKMEQLDSFHRYPNVPKDFRSASALNKGHGRIEFRTLTTSSQLVDFLDWPFHQQVFKLERHITTLKTGRCHHEVVYGITSLSAEQVTPDHLLRMLRSYWKIENSLHYRRDVTLQEDRTHFKSYSAAHVMAVINNILFGLLAKSEHR
jgi:hypothetical protein